MDWAQSEAQRSRNRPRSDDSSHGDSDHTSDATSEELALGSLFEAHGTLTEALQQHEDLERMARDEKELKEASERSRKDTRMDRNVSRVGWEGVDVDRRC
jgi:hypothetical protein